MMLRNVRYKTWVMQRRIEMPPKSKYTKEQIVAAALDIVAENGSEALTAKELAHRLQTSTSPIFTVFASMQEVQDEVKTAATELFERYAHEALADMPVFKQIGMRMILFAKQQPRLYQLIFMSPNSGVTPFGKNYAYLGAVAEDCLEAIQADYGLTAEDAQALFEHVWIHTFGIGALCATGACDFSEQEISKMLTQDFTAMMILLKTKKEE